MGPRLEGQEERLFQCFESCYHHSLLYFTEGGEIVWSGIHVLEIASFVRHSNYLGKRTSCISALAHLVS